jgi:hypothetical protein
MGTRMNGLTDEQLQGKEEGLNEPFELVIA